MKIRAILLLLMIGYKFVINLMANIGKSGIYPIYIPFPLFGIPEMLFWTCYWGIATLIMLTLLGSGTVIKNKTIVHNHPKETVIKEIKKESDDNTSEDLDNQNGK